MPIRRKSSSNKISGKTVEELQFEYAENHKIDLRVCDKSLVFENGKWELENVPTADLSTLMDENKRLEEENNFLKIKVEVLLLMALINVKKIKDLEALKPYFVRFDEFYDTIYNDLQQRQNAM